MKVIVIGGNFAGFTASLEIKRKLKEKAEVLVIDRNPDFLYIPSLIWVPTGRREIKNIVIPRKQVLEAKGVNFLQAVAERIDPVTRTVFTSVGEFSYDQLVIATGPK